MVGLGGLRPFLFLAATVFATATVWRAPTCRPLHVGTVLAMQMATFQPFRVRSTCRRGGISLNAAGTITAVSTRPEAQLHQVRMLSDAGNVDGCHRLFVELQPLLKDENVETQAWNLVLAAHGAAGRFSEAAEWHAKMGAAGVAVDTLAVQNLAQSAAHLGIAQETVRWLKLFKESIADMHPDTGARHALSLAGSTAVRACQTEVVSNLLQESARVGLTCDELGIPSIVAQHFREGDAPGVEKWINMLEAAGVQPSALCYAMVIDVHAGSKDPTRAERWTGAFRQAGAAKLDGSSYGTIINACARAGDVPGAQQWFETMEKAGLDPDADIYNSMMNAFAHAGDPVGASKWFTDIEKKGFLLSEDTFATVIRSFAEAGNAAVALQWLQKMKNDGFQPNTDCFDPVIRARAQQGDADGASQLVEEMFATGVAPSGYSYSAVVQSFAKKANTQGAKKWLSLMTDAGFEPDIDVYTAVLRSCAKAGLVAQAEEILSIIRGKGLRMKAETFNWALMAFGREASTKQPRRSTQTQETIKEAAQAAEGLFREMVEVGEAPTAFTIEALDRVLGKRRCVALCQELGVQVGAVGANRSTRKKWRRPRRQFAKPLGPYHDGGTQIKIEHAPEGGGFSSEVYEEDITWPAEFGTQMQRPMMDGTWTR